jgi:hypothetical protein
MKNLYFIQKETEGIKISVIPIIRETSDQYWVNRDNPSYRARINKSSIDTDLNHHSQITGLFFSSKEKAIKFWISFYQKEEKNAQDILRLLKNLGE